MVESKADALGIVAAEFPPDVDADSHGSRAGSRRRTVRSISPHPARRQQADRPELTHFLRPTRLLPTDGIVKETATKITRSAREDIDKARAIYDWVVENTYRDPKVRGCGVGDIRAMLESKTFGGKCADLNALSTSVSRARPASRLAMCMACASRSPDCGFKSLGLATATATKGQHCRAEVHLTRYGWVPVDPADVRKVMLEEPPGNLTSESGVVRKAREALFGSWEMNWIGFNFAHDARAARLGARHQGGILHVSAMRDRRRTRRPVRSGQLQIRDHLAGDRVRQALTANG